MIKFENTVTPSPAQWEAVIMGARNPMNSWEKSDSCFASITATGTGLGQGDRADYVIGPKDHDLLMRLCKVGTDHRKFMRMLPVMVTIIAPLYWWKEMDQYRVGQTTNSCSTMHKIHEKEFALDDFSHEHLAPRSFVHLKLDVKELNIWRDIYLNGYPAENGSPEIKPKDKNSWWQMIQLLPSSYNQKRTMMLNYEVLANIYKSRRNHKLDEWAEHKEIIPSIDSTSQAKYAKPYKAYFGFCDWIKTLPYSELITEIVPEKKEEV